MANNDKLVRQWATATLRGLGIRPTERNVTALVGWQHAEGGHTHNTARWNFLNTTLNLPGSGDTGTQGNISVYKNFHQGVQATVKTLSLPAYAGIRRALAHGSPMDVAHAIVNSPWGTSGLVLQTVSGMRPVAPVAGAGVNSGESSPLHGSGTGRGGPGGYTIPGVDNSMQRQQLLLDYLQQRGKPSALADLGLALQGAQDTPAQTVSYGDKMAPAGASGAYGGGNVKRLKGVANFEGHKVAAWIAPILQYARKHGWKGTVNSGYRSDAEQKRIYDSGVRPAAVPIAYGGHGSNHEFKAFPGGAVDVSDAQTLANILRGSKYRHLLVWAGGKDPVHFSHPHNGAY